MQILDTTDKLHRGYDLPDLKIGESFIFNDGYEFVCQGKFIGEETIIFSNPNYIITVRRTI